jgi:hypothetical protein
MGVVVLSVQPGFLIEIIEEKVITTTTTFSRHNWLKVCFFVWKRKRRGCITIRASHKDHRICFICVALPINLIAIITIPPFIVFSCPGWEGNTWDVATSWAVHIFTKWNHNGEGYQDRQNGYDYSKVPNNLRAHFHPDTGTYAKKFSRQVRKTTKSKKESVDHSTHVYTMNDCGRSLAKWERIQIVLLEPYLRMKLSIIGVSPKRMERTISTVSHSRTRVCRIRAPLSEILISFPNSKFQFNVISARQAPMEYDRIMCDNYFHRTSKKGNNRNVCTYPWARKFLLMPQHSFPLWEIRYWE